MARPASAWYLTSLPAWPVKLTINGTVRKKGKTQDPTRSVEMNSLKNPYNNVIAVTGPQEAVSGAFTLTID